MAEPIIQLKHLTKRFGGGENEVHALEDVSIEVRAGEIFRRQRPGRAPWCGASISWSGPPPVR